MAAGYYSSYALAKDGSLWTWGFNAQGQLGLGDTVNRVTPAHLFAPPGYKFSSIDSDAYGSHVLGTIVLVPEPATLSWVSAAGVMLFHRRRSSNKQAAAG